MTEQEYWLKVDEKFQELKADFKKRCERSTNTEFINDTVLGEIRDLWKFTDFRISYDSNGHAVYDGGRLRFARIELDNGKRDFSNEKHLELDAYFKFEKYLENDLEGVENYHLPNSVKEEIRKTSDAENLKKHLIRGDIDEFFKTSQAIFADIPYLIYKSKEGYFHSHLHLLLKMLGFKILSELSTNIGRIDSVIELTNVIYIMEFKIGLKETAIEQIKNKKYYQKYQSTDKKIILVGISCSEKERNIMNWQIEELQ